MVSIEGELRSSCILAVRLFNSAADAQEYFNIDGYARRFHHEFTGGRDYKSGELEAGMLRFELIAFNENNHSYVLFSKLAQLHASYRFDDMPVEFLEGTRLQLKAEVDALT